MPQNDPPYLDKSLVGFDVNDDAKVQVDTYNRLSSILNQKDTPLLTGNEKSSLKNNDFSGSPVIGPASNLQSPSSQQPATPDINIHDALNSDDPKIRAIGRDILDKKTNEVPEYRMGLGRTIETPYDQGKKFLDKDYGYSALRDNEDFYYQNDYMQDGALYRSTIKNPLRFLGRVAGGTIAKLGEGLGYMGSMVGSIGSDNYMQSVADNAFSKWFENKIGRAHV